jgi:hypothetical protein
MQHSTSTSRNSLRATSPSAQVLDALEIAVMHDKTYVLLVRDLMKSAMDQMNAKLEQAGPAMFLTIDDLKGSIDLTSFQQRFIGNDKDLIEIYKDMTTNLVKALFEEASLRRHRVAPQRGSFYILVALKRNKSCSTSAMPATFNTWRKHELLAAGIDAADRRFRYAKGTCLLPRHTRVRCSLSLT